MKKIYFLITFLATFYSQAQIVNIPDANFKAILLAASPSNTIASTQTPTVNGFIISTYNTIDTNGDGEIQISEASLIKYLKIESSNISNLEGISSFSNLQCLRCNNNQLSILNIDNLTNLTFLDCNYNQLSSLNVNGLTNLTYLYCAWNQITNLNVSGLNNLKYIVCYFNQLTNLELSNLPNLINLHCDDNQLTSLNLNTSNLTSLKALYCKNNQISSLNVNNLGILEILELDHNQISSLNLIGLTNLKNLSCIDNQLTSLDLSNLTKLTGLVCTFNQLQSLNICYSPNFTHLQCSNNQLTSLFIKNNNIAYWDNLTFENNPNLIFICADDDDFTLVQNKINSYGYANTCHVNSYCSFTPGGVFYTINGLNKLDGNGNGCEPTDSVYPNLKFSITNGSIAGSLISDISGNYSIPVAAGTHTITPQLENPSYFTIFPTSASVTFPATPSPFVQNFCITPNGTHHDLEVVIIPLTPARPGFDATYKIKYKNKGNLSETATLVFNYNDSVLDFVSSTLAPNSQSTGSLSWNIGTINPSQNGEFIVTLNVNSPMDTPAVNNGDILSYSAVFNGLNSDETPIDNTFSLNQTVVNSYDPNDKTCLEGNTINPSMIGQYVHYKIRFENTGTFPAQNIVVKDMIDTAKFDIATLQMTDASHACVTRISSPNKVEFIFESINLPYDDATNDGYVAFKIKTKNTLVVGNTISNLANIYFDYNFPIVTNTATSTFQVLQNDSFAFDTYFSVYPNPAKDVLNLKPKQDATIYSLSIYSILGQQLQTITNPEKTIDVSGLQSGNYFIKIVTDKGISSSKFIKE